MARTKFTKAEISWILYDVGNSALVLLATSVIPIYFNYLAAKDPAVEEVAVGAWGLAETIASLIIELYLKGQLSQSAQNKAKRIASRRISAEK